MSDARLALVLEDCVRALKAGASREDCLRAYPEYRAHLDPMLRNAAALVTGDAASFPPASRSSVRDEVMAAVRSEPREQRRGVLGLLPLPVFERPRLSWSLAALPAVAAVVAIALVVLQVAPFAGSGAAQGSTTLTVLQGEVMVETKDGVVRATSGMRLHPSDRIITSPDSRAVVTFFDGSTVTLEPETVVLIKDVQEVDDQLVASLTQEKGRTWTHVPGELGPADVKIDTPNASAQTSAGATFATSVGGGLTEVVTGSGAVSVQGSGESTEVTGGSRSAVDSQGGVTQPSVSPAAVRELVVRVQGADYAYLVGPSGAAVGIVPPGVPVNQVAGASRSRSGDITTIRVPEPLEGAYRLQTRSESDAAVSVSAVIVEGGSETVVASFKAGALETWQVRFAVDGLEVLPQAYTRETSPTGPLVPVGAIEKVQTATPTSRPVSTSTLTPTSTPTPVPTVRPVATPKLNATPLSEQLAPSSDLSDAAR